MSSIKEVSPVDLPDVALRASTKDKLLMMFLILMLAGKLKLLKSIQKSVSMMSSAF